MGWWLFCAWCDFCLNNGTINYRLKINTNISHLFFNGKIIIIDKSEICCGLLLPVLCVCFLFLAPVVLAVVATTSEADFCQRASSLLCLLSAVILYLHFYTIK